VKPWHAGAQVILDKPKKMSGQGELVIKLPNAANGDKLTRLSFTKDQADAVITIADILESLIIQIARYEK